MMQTLWCGRLACRRIEEGGASKEAADGKKQAGVKGRGGEGRGVGEYMRSLRDIAQRDALCSPRSRSLCRHRPAPTWRRLWACRSAQGTYSAPGWRDPAKSDKGAQREDPAPPPTIRAPEGMDGKEGREISRALRDILRPGGVQPRRGKHATTCRGAQRAT